MGKKILRFDNIDIEKNTFYLRKTTILQFGEKSDKDFIGYLYDNYKIKPLHIMLPKTSAYVKNYSEQTKQKYFLIEGNDLLEEYHTIWDKVSDDMEKEFDSDPVYNKNYLKTKINLMVMKLQIFMIKDFLSQTLIIHVQHV